MDTSTPASSAVRSRSRASLEDLAELCERAERVLKEARAEAFKPNTRKHLRPFTMSDVCELLDIHSTVFYETIRTAPELSGAKNAKNQWQFTLEEVHKLQGHLGKLPRQLYSIDRAVMIAVANFKGGVAKTLTAVLLAQYLALRGFRTLVIDTDPQGSLSSIFGQPSAEVDDWKTVLAWLYGRAMVEEDGNTFPASFREAVSPTYWHGLDMVAANLNLYSGEFALSLRRHQDKEFLFHRPLADAIEDVRGDYDVIISDMPPALSLSTAAGIFAADGLIIPAPAEMPDFESASAFMKLAVEILTAIRNGFGEEKGFEIFKILITKFQAGHDSHKDLARKILTVFEGFCVKQPMVQTAAVGKLAKNFLTLYEADPRAPGRAVLKRALEAANDVNADIEADLIDLLKERAAAKAGRSGRDDLIKLGDRERAA
jgi:chromosome partitioning protein